MVVEVAPGGVYFSDIGVRRGTIGHDFEYPRELGVEATGRVVETGAGEWDFVSVNWSHGYGPGSYAGLTASHFASDFYPVQPGDIAMVHAAAGGVGQLFNQIIKLRGGSVIGRVLNASKVDAAPAAGADHVIVDDGSNIADEAIRPAG